MLKDSWVLVLQQWGQAKFIISNSHPYNQIKHKGSNSIFPDLPPSPSRAEGNFPCHSTAHTNPTAAHSADVYACGHLHPSYSGKTIPGLIPPQGLGHPAGVTSLLVPPGSSEETLGSPTNTLEVPGVSSLLHQGCCGGTWSQCWRCLLRGCKRKAPSFQHATKQSPTLQASPSSRPPCTDIPRHEGFCPEDIAKAFTSGCEILVVPITGQGARACYFHHRMFSVGTFSCQPGETSHWRKPEPPNGFSSTSPGSCSSVRAAPSPEDEHQRGQLVSPAISSNKSNCLENT